MKRFYDAFKARMHSYGRAPVVYPNSADNSVDPKTR